MASASILFVSTDGEVIGAVRRVVSNMGHRLDVAASLDEVARRRHERACDALLLQTDHMDRLALARFAAERRDNVPVIVLARERSIPDAVSSIRAGASEYLPVYPLNTRTFRQALEEALSKCCPDHSGLPAIASLAAEGFISADDKVGALWELLSSVADSRSPILITGEGGTGKTLLAHAVHRRSGRRKGPLIEISCGSLSETLLEPELFGHARGAFVGARADRVGKFEAADGGTIILDEIGGASTRLQTRFLRILEHGEFERLGESSPRHCDVRVIASSRAAIEDKVNVGLFRGDLYERLMTVHVEVPPLRDRVPDVVLLARYYLKEFAERHGRSVTDFSPETLDILAHYTWPGNVRELKNVVERGVIMARGARLEADDLPRRVSESQPDVLFAPTNVPRPLREALREPERRCIMRALELADGNKLQAAADLGISRSTLYKKMKELGLETAEQAPLPGRGARRL